MTSTLLISEDMVSDALREVIDPELGENLVPRPNAPFA
jgi:metal-sulfur cluster biosynthetic enzyme